MPAPVRLRLPDATIYDFGGEFWIVCPRCAARALVLDRGAGVSPRIVLTCLACGLSRTWDGVRGLIIFCGDASQYRRGQVSIGDAVDWYFHLPLWLQTSCCGETLWAYNPRHLDWLEDFVRATMRSNERNESGWSNQSLRTRLPAWIKDGHNRPAILRSVAKLRRKIARG